MINKTSIFVISISFYFILRCQRFDIENLLIVIGFLRLRGIALPILKLKRVISFVPA